MSRKVAPGTTAAVRGSFIPWGWLAELGQVVVQADYPALFAILGTTYNTGGEGVGNFRLPDSRGHADIGAGVYTDTVSGAVTRTLGAKVGAEKHVLALTETPAHNHGGVSGNNSVGHTHGATTGVIGNTQFASGDGNEVAAVVNVAQAAQTTGGESQAHTHTIPSAGGGISHNNMQPSLAATKMIKW